MNKCSILLVRVSTLLQDYEPQIEDLKKYAKTMGYTKYKIIETKESGLVDLDKKVGTHQLFTFIKENPQYRVVFTTEISRLGRRQSVLHQIKEWFVKNNIQLFVKDIGYSLLDDHGKVTMGGEMMFSMYGLFAETEIQQKKDRFRRAKQSLMELGYSISGKPLFGYERVVGEGGKNTLVLHKENSNIVRTIFNWYINGVDIYETRVSIKRIVLESIKMGFPKYTHSKRNVNKLLKEEGYTGEKITNNKRKNTEYKEGESVDMYFVTNNKIKYPVIIDKDTFNLVQQRLKDNNSRVEKSTKKTTILSKLIKCEKCGNHYGGNYRIVKGRKLDTYRCSCRNGVGITKNTQSISMSMIDSSIWSLIKTDFYTLSRVISSYNPDKGILQLKKSLKILKKSKIEIDEKIVDLNKSLQGFSSIKDKSSKMFLDTIESKAKKLIKERVTIENEISKIELTLLSTNVDFNNLFQSIRPNLDSIEESKELLKKYINLFVEEIELLLHSQYYSIIKVKFKIDSRKMLDFSQVKWVQGVTPYIEIDSVTNIILDKRYSQKIKAFKSHLTIKKTNKQDKVTITTIDNSKVTISLDQIEDSQNRKYFKSFLYKKLNVY